MATRMQQRRGTAAQWVSSNGGDGPILSPGEIGYEIDTNKFKIGDGINHWADLQYFLDAEALGGSIDDYVPLTQKDAAGGVPSLDSNKNLVVAGASIIVEGATDNTFETTLTITDPTDDRTITFPNATGTVVLADGSGNVTVSGDLTVSGTTTTINSTTINATTGIVFEGATANDFETTLTVTDPTQDRTITFPDATGTVQLRVTDVSDTEIGYLNGVTSAIQTQLDDRSTASKTETLTNKTLTSPVINTPTGITKTDVGLANVDNTTDANKPVSTAGQAALDLKANLASPTFTGTVVLPTGTVTSEMILDGTILNADINASAAIDKTKISGTAITAGDTGTVTSTMILDGTIVDGDISASAAIVQSKISGLTTDLSAKAPLASPTFTGSVTLPGDPSSSLHAATKQYVDNTASGVVAKPQVLGATTANIDATYNNGTAGVGATLTHNTNGAFPEAAGGASGWAVGRGILVKNQTNKAQNGRYYVSDMGSASTPYVLTRCGYCDEASEIPGAYIFVQDGTNAGTGWIQVVADPATFVVGTDNIDVFQFSGSGTITAGTGITVNGNEVSINTAATVDLSTAQTLTNKTISGSNNTLTVRLSNDVSGTLPIANGGTGQTTAMTAATALLPDQSSNSGKYLTTNGSGTLSWETVSGYSAPTLGSTSIASGATVTTVTGLTLDGATLTGSLTAGASTGTNGFVLTSTGSGVQWAAPAGGGPTVEEIIMGVY
jgi:hypothetical protein